MSRLSPSFILLLFSLFLSACHVEQAKNQSIILNTISMDSKQLTIDKVQGHRGCRGLLPENTIPAFIKALELGIKVLELDVVISKDRQVIVSHEPWLSHEFCTGPKGEIITEENEKSYRIFEMTYEEIQQCDCGNTPHPRFPKQEKLKVHKPSLVAVIDAVEAYRKAHDFAPIWYNIELKHRPDYDGLFGPKVEEFVNLVLDVIDRKHLNTQCNLQSFDWETLRLLHKKNKAIPLAMLVENNLSPEENLNALGFCPTIYSCDFKLIDEALITWVKKQGLQLIPWTVNEVVDIERVLTWPIDGVITDYPDRVFEILNK